MANKSKPPAWDKIKNDPDYQALAPAEQVEIRKAWVARNSATAKPKPAAQAPAPKPKPPAAPPLAPYHAQNFYGLPAAPAAPTRQAAAAPKPPAARPAASAPGFPAVQAAQQAGWKQGQDSTLTGALQHGPGVAQLDSIFDGGFWQGAAQTLSTTNPLEVLQGARQASVANQFLAQRVDPKTRQIGAPDFGPQTPTTLAATQATTAGVGALADPVGLGIDLATFKAGSAIARPLVQAVKPAIKPIVQGATAVGAGAYSGGIQGAGYAIATGRPEAAAQEGLLSAGIAGVLNMPGAIGPKPAPAVARHAAPEGPPKKVWVTPAPAPVHAARMRAGALGAKVRRDAATPPQVVNPRAAERMPPMRPLHPGHNVGPAARPDAVHRPTDATFPEVADILEAMDVQQRAQGAAVATPYEAPLPILPELAVPGPSLERGQVIRSAEDNLPMFKGTASARDLNLDAHEYQFKSSTIDMNNTGKTERLTGGITYDPRLASNSPVTVHQRLDGSLYVVDGHQRTNFAKAAIESGQQIPDLDIRILREADGWTTKRARNYGAYLNLSQGTGTAIDAAKIIRDKGLTPAEMRSLPQKGPEAEPFVKGREIAKLGNEAFGLAINMFPQDPAKGAMIAAQVGQRVKTPEIQAAILREFINDAPSGAQEVSNMIDQLLADGFDQMSTDQLSMFGREVLLQSNARPISKMLVALGNDIKADKATAGRLIRTENRVTAIEGNTVNREATAAKLDEAKTLEQSLALLGVQDQTFRNDLAAILKAAEARQAGDNGKKGAPVRITRQEVAAAREALQQALARKEAAQAAPQALDAAATAPQAIEPAAPAIVDPYAHLTPEQRRMMDFYDSLNNEVPAPAPAPARPSNIERMNAARKAQAEEWKQTQREQFGIDADRPIAEREVGQLAEPAPAPQSGPVTIQGKHGTSAAYLAEVEQTGNFAGFRSSYDSSIGPQGSMYLAEPATAHEWHEGPNARMNPYERIADVETRLERPLQFSTKEEYKAIVTLAGDDPAKGGLTRGGWERLKAQGYDGVIIRNADPYIKERFGGDQVIAFYPERVTLTQSPGPRVSSDQMGLFGNDPILRLVADESGAMDLNALGASAGRAITFLRDAYRKMLAGVFVDPAAVERAANMATASEMRGRATPEQIRAKAKERARRIREAADTQALGTGRPVEQPAPSPAPVTPTQQAPAVTPERPAEPPPVAEVAPRTIDEPAPAPAPETAATPEALTPEAPAPEAPATPTPRPEVGEPALRRFEAFLRKQNFSPEMEAKLRQDMREGVATQGWDDVTTTQDYVNMAQSMGLDPSMLRVPAPGETIPRPVYAKLLMELKGIDAEILAAQARVRELSGNGARTNDLMMAEANLERLNQDSRAILDVLMPARSQDGRNLAFHRWMAERSFDEAFWVTNARRAYGQGDRVEIPNEQAFRDTLRRGREAQERMQGIIDDLEAQGVTGHGIDPSNPELDHGRPLAGAEDDNPLGPLVSDEEGTFSPQAVGDWLMNLRDRKGNVIPENDPGRRLSPDASLDPKIQKLIRDGWIAAAEVRAARMEVATTMRNLQRMPLSEVVTTMRKGLLLLSARVVQMNVTGGLANTVLIGASRNMAAPVDMLLGAITGRRMVTAGANPMNWDRIAHASKKAATKGVKEAMQVMRHGMTHDQLMQLDFPHEMVTGNRWFNRVFDGTVNLGFRLAMAPDRIPRTFAIESSLFEQSKLWAAYQAKQDPTIDKKAQAKAIYEQLTDPTAAKVLPEEDIQTIKLTAAADGDYVSLTNKTAAGEALKAIHNALRVEELAPYRNAYRAAVDLQVPFKQVPSAAFSQSLDYSGVSAPLKAAANINKIPDILKDGLTPAQQKAISMAAGRAGVGWSLILAGLYLWQGGWKFEVGGLEVDDAEGAYDRETKDVNEAAGRTSSSVKIKAPWMEEGRWVPVGQIPGGNLIVLGATLQHLGANWLENFARTGIAAARGALDTPALQGAANTLKAFEDGEGAGKLFASLAGSFVPTGVADIATAMDPSGEAPELRKEWPGNIQDAVSARLPGVRNSLPRKQTALGQPVEAPTGIQAFNRFYGKADRTKDNPALAEMIALNKQLPEKGKLKITKPTHAVKIGGVKVTMPPDVAREYDKLVGEMVAERLARVASHPKYKAMDAEDRKAALDEQETKIKRGITAAVKGEAEAPAPIATFLRKHRATLAAEYRKAKAAGGAK